jgi:uncharacterized protein YecT (DUF1311 family)
MKTIKLLFWFAAASAAFVGPISQARTECLGAGNTLDQQSCFMEKQERAEEKLNDTYRRLIPLAKSNFDPELENDLRRAERAWIDYRKLNCQFYGRKDRARHNFEALDCMLRMTREREIELRAAAEELANR